MKMSIHKSDLFAKNELSYAAGNILIIDLNEMRFIDASPQILLMLGYTPEELLAQSPREVVFIDVDFTFLLNSFSDGDNQHKVIQTVYRQKNNSTILAEAHICRLEVPGKGIYIIINSVIICDVTTKQMTEQTIKNFARPLGQLLLPETNNFAQILERISDGLMAFDSSWKYTYINKKAAEIYHLNHKKLIGTRLWTDSSQVSDALRYQDYQKAMQEQKLICREFYVQSMDKWFEEKLHPSPEGLTVYLHDITDIRNTGLALQESEDLYRRAQSKGKLGHWIRDLSNDKSRWSDETYNLFGVDKSVTLPDFDTYLNIVHPDDRETVLENIRSTITDGTPYNIIYRIILQDGDIRYMHAVAELIKDNTGQPIQLTGMVQDVTQQKLTENALLLSEKNYRLLFEENPVPLWMTDVENYIVIDVNQAALRQYGYAKNEFVGMHLESLRTVKDNFPAPLPEHHVESYKIEEFIISHKKRNGETMQVSIKASPIEYKERKVWLIAGRDVTQDLLNVSLLMKSQKQLSLIFNNIQNTMWLLKVEDGKSLRFEAVNDTLVTQVGINREEIVGRLIDEVFDANTYQFIFSKYYECLSSGVAQKFDAAVQSKRGEQFVQFAFLPIKNDDGNIVQLLGIGENITDQKKAEKKLTASEEKYRILFERSPLPKIIFEEKTLQILEVNLAAMTLYGYSRKEFQNMTLFDIRPAEQFDDLRKFFNDGVPQSYIFNGTHNKKNGELIKVNITANHIHYENKDARIVTIVDRTEQEKAKDELITTTQNLRDLASHLQNIREEERTNIAREIHDELGQQLTGIKMDISWLGKKLQTENETIREKISTSLELIDTTINTVREIATKLRPSILDDLGLAETIRWHSGEFSKRTGIRITFDTDIEDDRLSPAIAIALFRIYQESLTNVARHANATTVNSSLKIKETNIFLTIADDGTGLPIHEKSKRKTLGILGMRERASMLNGNFSIDNIPGKGTRVLVQLPLAN